jgi:type IX secretion system PorP/SprF family membrane protein
MKKRLTIVLLYIFTGVFAQQDAYFTTYNYNLNSINPAFSMGNRGSMRSGFTHRKQWLGLENAPNTSEFFMHYALSTTNEMAITIQNDHINDILNETTVALDYSHNLFINAYSYFSLGIKASVTMFNADFNQLSLETGDYTTDPSFLDNPKKVFPNFGVGAFWYDEDYNYYVGVSSPNLFSKEYYNVTENTYKYAIEKPHIYLTAGTLFEIGDDIVTRPSFLIRYASGNPTILDLNNMLKFNDKFEVGLSYSLGVSVSVLAAIKFKENWKVGYNYGMPTNKLFGEQTGSHEIYLMYDVNFSGTRYRSTRSF